MSTPPQLSQLINDIRQDGWLPWSYCTLSHWWCGLGRKGARWVRFRVMLGCWHTCAITMSFSVQFKFDRTDDCLDLIAHYLIGDVVLGGREPGVWVRFRVRLGCWHTCATTMSFSEQFKCPATCNDFVNDIVNDRALDAIFATLKAIVDDVTSTISLRVAWP